MLTYKILDKTEDNLLIEEYHRMRFSLWPEHGDKELREEMALILKGDGFDNGESSWTVFVVQRENGLLGGFAEITIYPSLSYCDTKDIGYIEGWYIDEDLRKQGVGKKLIETAERWLIDRGSQEIASDVEDHNIISQNAHKAIGFTELHKEDDCIFYKKQLI